MLFRYNILFLIVCLEIIYVHCISAEVTNFKIVPKSIDYKTIKWHGIYGLARDKEKKLKAYIHKGVDFNVLGRKTDAMFLIHDKKACHGCPEYYIEYWTEDGHAWINTLDSFDVSKGHYYFYKSLYKAKKNK